MQEVGANGLTTLLALTKLQDGINTPSAWQSVVKGMTRAGGLARGTTAHPTLLFFILVHKILEEKL